MEWIMRKYLILLALGFMVLLAGCSEQPSTPAKKTAAAQPVTGQSALYRMYQVARSWAPDANVLKMNSIHLTEVAGDRGKAGAWQATFTSAVKSSARTYTYSVVEGEGNLHEGVFPGPEESWSGPSEKPFLIAAVKVDTDAAYKTALKEAADYDKKNPKQTISFDLARQERFPDPAWRVIWGESAGTAGLSVLVDASTGMYLQTLH
ncbi:MAG: hypothetical protein C5B51_05430 [Terriglobia bacterium]|nr:MAG: hypothetical protein C5B51_05430 [Terriglobia bacterium]